MSKRLFDGAKITRVPYAKITCVPSPVHGLPYAKITRVRGYSRMQNLHAINNYQGIGGNSTDSYAHEFAGDSA
mgnify:CR=1 FL=1